MIYYHISISNSNQRFKTLFYNTQYHNDGLVLLLNFGRGPPVANIRASTKPLVFGSSFAFNLRSAVVAKSFKLGWSSLLIAFLITFSAVFQIMS